MKLLSWMHRKLQNDNTGVFKNSAIGASCLSLKTSLDNQEDYARLGNNSKVRHQPQDENQHYLKEFNAKNTAEFNNDIAEIFPGFLTIGTLSMEPITESPTPTFEFPQEETDVNGISDLKHDLNLIDHELEKFLWNEDGKEASEEQSDCKSYTSTVNPIDMENQEESEYKLMQAYPLQEYLLGTSNEVQATKQKAKKEKTTLQDLFHNSKMLLEKSDIKGEDARGKTQKEFESSVHQVTKTHGTSKKASYKNYSTLPKLNKIKRLFNKKIHPEASTITKDPNKLNKYDNKSLKNKSPSHPVSTSSCHGNSIDCWGALVKKENHHSKTTMYRSRDESTMKKRNDPSEVMSGGIGREHWINTDDDYLVLELQQIGEAGF